MPYTKKSLRRVVVSIVGELYVLHMSMPESVEAAAEKLFLVNECDSPRARVIREAYNDMIMGKFEYIGKEDQI